MRSVVHVATALAAVALSSPSFALSGIPNAVPHLQAPTAVDRIDWDPRRVPHTPRYGGYVGENGGYKVNRYGYGNYVGGPGGGFAGYPAGSPEAQIYKQKQEWKCQNVPETC